MTDRASVDLESLRLTARAVRSYDMESARAQDRAKATADRVLRTLNEELAARRRAHSTAQGELGRCLSQTDADCSTERRRVANTEDRVGVAERALSLALRAVDDYRPASVRFTRERQSGVDSALAALSRLGLRIEGYLAGSSGTGTGPSDAQLATSSPGAMAVIPGAPVGWAFVPLSMIDDSDRSIGPADFTKGYSVSDLAWALSALTEVVLPTMARSGERALEDLRQRDAHEGRSGTRSYADTFSGFFGDDAVKVDGLPDGKFSLTNGYHRVWIAKHQGLSHIPARLR